MIGVLKTTSANLAFRQIYRNRRFSTQSAIHLMNGKNNIITTTNITILSEDQKSCDTAFILSSQPHTHLFNYNIFIIKCLRIESISNIHSFIRLKIHRMNIKWHQVYIYYTAKYLLARTIPEVNTNTKFHNFSNISNFK